MHVSKPNRGIFPHHIINNKRNNNNCIICVFHAHWQIKRLNIKQVCTLLVLYITNQLKNNLEAFRWSPAEEKKDYLINTLKIFVKKFTHDVCSVIMMMHSPIKVIMSLKRKKSRKNVNKKRAENYIIIIIL